VSWLRIRNIIQSSFRASWRDPESRHFKGTWIPGSAGMTARRDQLIRRTSGTAH